jgi:tetratricopeptide (TPR) repeat protein
MERLFATAPWSANGYDNMQQLRLMAQSGRCPALDPAAWNSLAQALLSNPVYAGNGVSAGYLHYQLSELAVAQGDLDATIAQLRAAYRSDPDAEIPRLEAKYLASAGLYQEAIQTLQHADYSRLPLLRRLLVNDRAINEEGIAILRKQEAEHAAQKSSR